MIEKFTKRKEIARIKEAERSLLVEERYKGAVAKVIEDLSDKGLLGVHELRAIPPVSTQTQGEIHGRIAGSFLSFSGSIDGQVESQPSVRFAWVTNNEARRLVISELPSNKFTIEQGDPQQSPTVQFDLNRLNFINARRDEDSPVGFRLFTTSHPHPNDYLKGDNLKVARITVSQKGFENLRTLSPERFLTK